METRESHNLLYNSTREFLFHFDSTSCAPPNNLGGMPRSGKFCFIVCVCVCVWTCVCLGSHMRSVMCFRRVVEAPDWSGKHSNCDGYKKSSPSAAQAFPAYCKCSGTISWRPLLGSVARARLQRAPLPIASVSRPMYVRWCFFRAPLATPLPTLGLQHFQQLE